MQAQRVAKGGEDRRFQEQFAAAHKVRGQRRGGEQHSGIDSVGVAGEAVESERVSEEAAVLRAGEADPQGNAVVLQIWRNQDQLILLMGCKICRSGVGVVDVQRLLAGEGLYEIGEGTEVGVGAVEDEVADVVDFAVVGESHFAGDGARVGVEIRHAVLHLNLLQALCAVDDAPGVDHHWRIGLLPALPPRHAHVQRGLNHLPPFLVLVLHQVRALPSHRPAVSRCLLAAGFLRRMGLISCQQLVELVDA